MEDVRAEQHARVLKPSSSFTPTHTLALSVPAPHLQGRGVVSWMGMWAERGIYTQQPVPGGEARQLVMFLLLKPRGSELLGEESPWHLG